MPEQGANQKAQKYN